MAAAACAAAARYKKCSASRQSSLRGSPAGALQHKTVLFPMIAYPARKGKKRRSACSQRKKSFPEWNFAFQ